MQLNGSAYSTFQRTDGRKGSAATQHDGLTLSEHRVRHLQFLLSWCYTFTFCFLFAGLLSPAVYLHCNAVPTAQPSVDSRIVGTIEHAYDGACLNDPVLRFVGFPSGHESQLGVVGAGHKLDGFLFCHNCHFQGVLMHISPHMAIQTLLGV